MIETPAYYDPSDPLLRPRDVAGTLGIHKETLYRWMRLGIIAFVYVGPETAQRRRKRIRTSEVTRILEERRASVA